ncbi:MAG: cytochrome c-type protein NapB [Planctomycetota bacterium]|jgi:cytochrome c-type protein NapB
MTESSAPTPRERLEVTGERVLHVVYVVAIAAAVLGLYFGIRYDPIDVQAQPKPAFKPASIASKGVRPALDYKDIQRGYLGPNAEWETHLPAPRALTEQWTLVSLGDRQTKLRDLSEREKRRAYNGAPPTIPHRIDPLDVASCTACHGPDGMIVGDVVARPMPHEAYASCTQCHVPQRFDKDNEEGQFWAANSFAGLAAPTEGSRAWVGAPPTIPHATKMRSNCMACHGPLGASGLQSSHPWRSSCTQCHAPSSTLDQPPGMDRAESMFLPPIVER